MSFTAINMKFYYSKKHQQGYFYMKYVFCQEEENMIKLI